MAVLSAITSGVSLLHYIGLTPEIKSDTLGYIGETLAADNGPVSIGYEIDIQKSFTLLGSTLIAIIFLLTSYITFCIDETESNKHRVALASDIFKTILGFITGVLATTLKSSK
jgi:hypothetical protein